MPSLSEEQRNRTIEMLMATVTVKDVSHAFGCTRQTIHKLMTRYLHTGTVLDHQRPGRPRATTMRTDCFITLTHMSTLFASDDQVEVLPDVKDP